MSPLLNPNSSAERRGESRVLGECRFSETPLQYSAVARSGAVASAAKGAPSRGGWCGGGQGLALVVRKASCQQVQAFLCFGQFPIVERPRRPPGAVSLQTYQVKTSECNLPTRDPPAGGCLLLAQHTASRQLLLLATLLFKSRVAGAAVRLVRRSIAVKSSGCLLETLTCECLSRSVAFLSVCAATQPNNSVIILMCRIPGARRCS
ncbi:hypothetical protein E2C01_028850 [Portunus trituberculatus]|uniref:Uncharacterized protein n=1 Tax=Portunus trituberculatus TaxID=210409 RepID=A0A5B7EQ63_PORTR|nr:hypothetical protein [Portunus trituberculatus]